MIALLLSAALQAQGSEPTAEAFDLTCLRMSMLASAAAKQPKQKQAFLSLGAFYIGRLSARDDSDSKDWPRLAGASGAGDDRDLQARQRQAEACIEKMRRASHIQ